jgi:RsiW-degrading membrane proteinase PrsW (M82 family)
MATLLWPVRPTQRASAKDQRRVLFEFVFIWFICLGLGVYFSSGSGRRNPSIATLLLSSGIAGLGLTLIAVPSAWYLDFFNSGLLSVTFSVSLALVFILVTSKSPLVDIYLNMPSDTPGRSFFQAFFVAATLEEILKFVAYIGPLIFSEKFRNVYHLTFLSICASCCFATIENLIIASRGPVVMLQRFAWCTLTHSSDSVVGALILAHIMTRYSLTDWRGLCMLPLVILCPVALHGTYDFVIFLSNDVVESWVAGLCFLVGAISVLIAMGLFYPFRRSKWSLEESALESDKIHFDETRPDYNVGEI